MQPIKVNRVGIAALVLVLIIAGFVMLQLELFGDRRRRARFEGTVGVGGAADLDTEANSALSKLNAELNDLRSERSRSADALAQAVAQLEREKALTKLGALKLASVSAEAAADHDRLEHEVAELAAEQRDTARAAHETGVQGRDDPRLQPDRDATTTKSIPHVDLQMDPFLYRRPIEPGQHRLGVLVPFRNVTTELNQFVPYMHDFLQKQGVDFDIFVINQTDTKRFNRGQLLNVGFLLAAQSCDYVVMHDVDLLPLNTNLSYRYPQHIMHLASAKFHPIYKFPKFIGGIMVMKNEHFIKINGLSNKYWGWGREDDDLRMRITTAEIEIEYPENYTEIATGRVDTLLHMHDKVVRPRDYMKLGNQRAIGKTLDNQTGLSSARHKVVKIAKQFVQGNEYTRIDVELECDDALTPWCKMYEYCNRGYYRVLPWHKICSPCVKKCWLDFALVGSCTNTTTPVCLRVGRDISVEEAAKWPAGRVVPAVPTEPWNTSVVVNPKASLSPCGGGKIGSRC